MVKGDPRHQEDLRAAGGGHRGRGSGCLHSGRGPFRDRGLPKGERHDSFGTGSLRRFRGAETLASDRSGPVSGLSSGQSGQRLLHAGRVRGRAPQGASAGIAGAGPRSAMIDFWQEISTDRF